MCTRNSEEPESPSCRSSGFVDWVLRPPELAQALQARAAKAQRKLPLGKPKATVQHAADDDLDDAVPSFRWGPQGNDAENSTGTRCARPARLPLQAARQTSGNHRRAQSATVDADTIRQWWQQEPQYNVAIATGAASNIFVVDIDGLDAEAELARLEAQAARCREPSKRSPRAAGISVQMPDIPVRNTTGKIAAGIDMRGDGGYVSRRQEFIRADAPMRGASTAPAPWRRHPTGCWTGSPSVLTATVT